MSSLAGHTLAGAAICLYGDDGNEKPGRLLLFVFVAVFPDSDYVLDWIFKINFSTRFTHSVMFCSIMPIVILFILKPRSGKMETGLGIRLFAASYSHLLLDLSVGVSAFPLLWPIFDSSYKLPFGVLPSAGSISFSNFYFYRNLLIELGILIPAFLLLLIPKSRDFRTRLTLLACLSVLIPFIIWGVVLDR